VRAIVSPEHACFFLIARGVVEAVLLRRAFWAALQRDIAPCIRLTETAALAANLEHALSGARPVVASRSLLVFVSDSATRQSPSLRLDRCRALTSRRPLCSGLAKSPVRGGRAHSRADAGSLTTRTLLWSDARNPAATRGQKRSLDSSQLFFHLNAASPVGSRGHQC